jgi:CheY-like chemotaxis protein
MSKRLQRLTYVEDEPDIRAITEFALKEIGGFDVDVCTSGPEAIARTPAFAPDLIILDVMMPGMDGIETFNRLRSMPRLAQTPIVFMTAKAMKHETDRYRALGAADVIPKPFDPIALSDQIRDIWRRAQKRMAEDAALS